MSSSQQTPPEHADHHADHHAEHHAEHHADHHDEVQHINTDKYKVNEPSPTHIIPNPATINDEVETMRRFMLKSIYANEIPPNCSNDNGTGTNPGACVADTVDTVKPTTVQQTMYAAFRRHLDIRKFRLENPIDLDDVAMAMKLENDRTAELDVKTGATRPI